jgi:hypothetical protein
MDEDKDGTISAAEVEKATKLIDDARAQKDRILRRQQFAQFGNYVAGSDVAPANS